MVTRMPEGRAAKEDYVARFAMKLRVEDLIVRNARTPRPSPQPPDPVECLATAASAARRFKKSRSR